MQLFAAQQTAIEKADYRPGFGFLLEQGLGKTGLALTEFNDLKSKNKADLMIVVCPNSLKNNWEEEIKKWLEQPIVGVWPQWDPRKEKAHIEAIDVFIINYEALLGQGFEATKLLLENNRVYMALDESTRIKNHAAQTTKKLLTLSKLAVYRRILTGTPMVQNVMDLWPQLRFIGELDGINPFAFRNHFAVMGGYMGKQVVGCKNEAELQRLLDGCSFRAKKKDWLKDLPEKLPPVTRDVQMTPEQLQVYKEMKEDFYTLVQKNEISASQAIVQMERLSQISRGFLYDENHKILELVEPERNPCVKELFNILEESEGKVIIFALHDYAIRLLRKVLPQAAFIVKDQDLRQMNTTVEEQRERFNKDNKCRHIISQLSVGSHGHTLLGGPGDDRCATTVFFENSYSLEKRLQAEDRNHRIGQDRGVSYFDIAASPIDRKVIRALQNKQDVVKSIIDAVRTYH